MRYLISRDEPGSTEECILDEAATESECRRKLADWQAEYPYEVSAWDTVAERYLSVHDDAQKPFA